MKVTYNEIFGAHQALQAMAQNGAATFLPLAALKLARAARVIGQEAEAFEAGRVALINRYVPESDAQGNRIVPPERRSEFNAELGELAKQEVEIDVQLLTLADLGDCPVSLFGMEWLIDA